ncbi:MAG: sugar ABC transporter permease [Chloroflexi bacterium]|nr:sugar ABC transporter permease [Chloroflexota bacterium]
MAVAQARAKRQITKTERDEWIAGWLFISPVVLGLLIWTLLPTVASLILSFTDYRVLRPPVWLGFDNYVAMFTRQQDFRIALRVTFTFVAIQLPIGLMVALGGAMLLNTGVKGMTVFRTFFYLPSVVPAVATALVWGWILNLNYGLVNQFVNALGFPRINFFGNPKTALPTLAVMTWFSVGQTMIIYLAGLLNIPPSLYEAAEIDGAGRFRKFLNITLPMLSPTLFYTVVMGLILSFQYFTQAFILTAGGPMKATYFYNLMIYNEAFSNLKMGYAAALAWFLLLMILAMTLTVFRSSAAWVYYESEARS